MASDGLRWPQEKNPACAGFSVICDVWRSVCFYSKAAWYPNITSYDPRFLIVRRFVADLIPPFTMLVRANPVP